MSIKADDFEIHKARGDELRALKRFKEALASYDQALMIKPDDFQILKARGHTLNGLKRFKDALASYNRVLAITPDDFQALKARGDALSGLKRYRDAVASYDRALKGKPDYAEALNNRSHALRRINQFDDALVSVDRSLAARPDSATAIATRAAILLTQGKADQAIAYYRNALAIAPENATLHSNLIFALNFDPDVSGIDKQSERALWERQHAQKFSAYRPHTNDPNEHRRLRVGYVSSHFRRQAATYAFGGVLLSHDPKQVEVFCYSDTLKEDDVTASFRGRVDHWHHTVELSNDELAELIRHDEIDILVDLVGHMFGNRLLTFARKPAPIQVTAWGEPTGTGLKVMDYLLADSFLVPETEKALLAERVVNLPNFLGYWAPVAAPDPGPLPVLQQGHVTFGSFSRIQKLTNPAISAWASILCKLPTARLVLKTNVLADENQRARIEKAFTAEGISAERLTFLGNSERVSHLAAYQMVDIALDPFPHSGGMTTLDALWMGVPVVTWAGDTISARLAASCLTALALSDFVANSRDAYVDLAVAKASDVEALSRLRAGLRSQLAASEFGDSKRYCLAVEAAFREMWQRWCSRHASLTC